MKRKNTRQAPLSLTVKDVSLTTLQPHPDHQLRWCGDTEVDRWLVRSIQEFGVMEPLIVEEETYRIVEGHRRYGAARVLGMSCVPCIIRQRMSEAEYAMLRFTLYETYKPLTKQQLQKWRRRAGDKGVDIPPTELMMDS